MATTEAPGMYPNSFFSIQNLEEAKVSRSTPFQLCLSLDVPDLITVEDGQKFTAGLEQLNYQLVNEYPGERAILLFDVRETELGNPRVLSAKLIQLLNSIVKENRHSIVVIDKPGQSQVMFIAKLMVRSLGLYFVKSTEEATSLISRLNSES